MVYWISLYILRFIARTFFHGEVYDVDNLPTKGPYIGVVNHNSHLDTLAMAMAMNQRAHTMAKDSLFKIPILKWWLKAVHMFPVVRDASDHQAFNHALEVLKQGEILFMAPEGTRKKIKGERRRPRTGFVRLAQMVNCPVVPVAIWGTDKALPPGSRFPRPVKIRVKVGKPFCLEKINELTLRKKDQLQKQADSVMEQVYSLYHELEAMEKKKYANQE